MSRARRREAPADLGPTLEGEVTFTALAHGGAAVGRLDGLAIFVPYACPGDRALVRTTLRRERFAEGELLTLLEASSERVEPICPLFGSCGGCHWQHVSPATQLVAKRDIVLNNLRRVGGLTVSDIKLHPSPSLHGWRQKARVHRDAEGRVGFLAARGHELIAHETCPMLLPKLNHLIQCFNKWLGEKRLPLAGFSATYSPIDAVGAVHLAFDSDATPALAELASSVGEVEGLAGLVVTTPSTRHEFGAASLRIAPPAPCVDTLHPVDAFWQANHELNLSARHILATLLKQHINASDRVLELFAGSGNLSGEVVRLGHPLVAVESEGSALDASRRNHQGARETQFIAGDAAVVLADLVDKGECFQAVLLDPPRAGFKEGIPDLLRLAPRHLFYQSCDSATFARDARPLLDAGYRLDSIDLFDFFPHTFHTETLAIFSRNR